MKTSLQNKEPNENSNEKNEQNNENKSVTFKLYPNKEQVEKLRQNLGCTRFVYNYFLDFKIKEYEKFKKEKLKNSSKSTKSKTSSSFELIKMLPQLKQAHPWLAEADSTSLQQALKNLDCAYKNFFRRVKQGQTPGFPKFKRKGQGDSFRCVMNLDIAFDVEQSSTFHLKVGKHGWILARGSSWFLNFQHKIQNITVKERAGAFYATVLIRGDFSERDKLQSSKKYKKVAVDLGVVKPLTVFNGSQCVTRGLKTQKALEILEKKRRKYTKAFSRKKKGSCNFLKSKRKLQKLFLKETNLRKEFVEKQSLFLCKSARQIVFEDLSIQKMTKKESGHKKHLNRKVLQLGLSSLVSRTETKSREWGCSFHKVNPAYTSQTCNSCGTISKKSRKNQSTFECVSCGYSDNADFNAARNIFSKLLATC